MGGGEIGDKQDDVNPIPISGRHFIPRGGQEINGFHRCSLSPPRFLRPQQPVQLELQPDIELVFQDPGRQVGAGKAAGNRGEENPGSSGLSQGGEHLFCPAIVRGRGNDEFHLVGRGEIGKIVKIHPIMHGTVRTFDIHDLHHPGVEPGQADGAIGLQQDASAAGQQDVDERIDVLLQQRLTAGDLDQGSRVGGGLFLQLADGQLRGRLFIGVTTVAPRTTQVAPRQPDKKAGIAGMVPEFSVSLVDTLYSR
jgi:hypothetical protein